MLTLSGRDYRIAVSYAGLVLFQASLINQWMGNLFYRRVAPSEIEAMDYHRMKYWNEWHKLMEKAEVKANQPKEK